MMGLFRMFGGPPHTNGLEVPGARTRERAAAGAPPRWLGYGLVAVALLWVLGTVGFWSSGSGRPGSTAAQGTPVGAAAPSPGAGSGPRQYEQALAAELESLLSRVQGAGRVAVSLTLASGPGQVLGYNTTSDTRETEERDPGGSTRMVREATTSQQPVVLRDGTAGERALVREETRPEVTGVLVLSEGAGSAEVRLHLVRAVQALFRLPAHRITVLPMGR